MATPATPSINLFDLSEQEVIERIYARYHGNLNRILGNEAEHAQLALDLGFLIGIASRLLRDQADAKGDTHGPSLP